MKLFLSEKESIMKFIVFILFTFSQSNHASIKIPSNIGSYFDKEHPSCFLIKEIGVKKIHSFNKQQCKKRKEPYSTFKILNSLIALETGVIDGNKTIIPWDGKKKFIKAWEQNHNIETAIKYSVVPFYQEVARRIGKKNMKKYVNLAKYGNRNIGQQIDRFWLDGPIKISAYEQLNFIENLYLNKLPFKKQNQKFVRKILIQEKDENGVFSGKTGSSYKDGRFVFGWFVGHLQKGEKQYVFVINSKGENEAGHKLKKTVNKILKDMNL